MWFHRVSLIILAVWVLIAIEYGDLLLGIFSVICYGALRVFLRFIGIPSSPQTNLYIVAENIRVTDLQGLISAQKIADKNSAAQQSK